MKEKEEKQSILIVDDDVDFLDQLKMQLVSHRFQVLTAQTQKEAEHLLQQTVPDLAILDLMLEHFDGGFSLAYQIKKRHPQVPVIIVSGVTSETGIQFDSSTAEEKNWVKADTFLAKPIRFEQLLKEINRLLTERIRHGSFKNPDS